jgi:hypothetical protein
VHSIVSQVFSLYVERYWYICRWYVQLQVNFFFIAPCMYCSLYVVVPYQIQLCHVVDCQGLPVRRTPAPQTTHIVQTSLSMGTSSQRLVWGLPFPSQYLPQSSVCPFSLSNDPSPGATVTSQGPYDNGLRIAQDTPSSIPMVTAGNEY